MKRRRLYYLLAAAAFLAAAIVFRIGFFAYAFYAAVLVALIAWMMSFVGLEGMTVERVCNRRHGEIGQDAQVTVGIHNARPFFVPWVIAEDILGSGLRVEQGVSARALVMPPMGHTTLKYTLRLKRRGYHRVGPVLFESGDFFGLARRFRAGDDVHFVTVYPRIVPIDRYSVPSHRPLGETTVQMRLFEDPTRIAGVREYRYGDPLRRVHWKASARTGRLHSKIFDPSCILGVNIVLDFAADAWTGDARSRRIEFAATVAASLASHLADRGADIGFVSNGVDAADVIQTNPISVEVANRDEARRLLEHRQATERLRPVQVVAGRGGETLHMILETLARLEPGTGLALPQMIAREYNAWPREQTVALIVPAVSEELTTQIVRLKNANFSVLVLLIDNPSAAPRLIAGMSALNVHLIHLRRDEDLLRIVL
jgi:uncharacterized protein (DUF58 family)